MLSYALDEYLKRLTIFQGYFLPQTAQDFDYLAWDLADFFHLQILNEKVERVIGHAH
jgi:hypothetical protein